MKAIAILGYVVFVIISIAAISCKDELLDIQQAYSFKVTHLPIPSNIPENGMVEIRCTLETESNYKDVTYHIRFFQNKGKGQLFLENTLLAVPNDLYPLENKIFRLYYKARSTKDHQFDVYVEDNFGQIEKVSFYFGTQVNE